MVPLQGGQRPAGEMTMKKLPHVRLWLVCASVFAAVAACGDSDAGSDADTSVGSSSTSGVGGGASTTSGPSSGTGGDATGGGVTVDDELACRKGWCWVTPFPDGGNLDFVDGVDDDAWIWGSGGALFHWDGATLVRHEPGDMVAAYIESPRDGDDLFRQEGEIWIRSNEGKWKYDGTQWSYNQLSFSGGSWLLNDGIIVLGGSGLSTFDGTDVEPLPEGPADFPALVWGGSAADLNVMYNNGGVAHFDGAFWTVVASGPGVSISGFRLLRDGSVTARENTGGVSNEIFVFDGSAWLPPISTPQNPLVTAGMGADDFYIYTFGTRARLHWDGVSLTDTGATPDRVHDVLVLSDGRLLEVGQAGLIRFFDGVAEDYLSEGPRFGPIYKPLWFGDPRDLFFGNDELWVTSFDERTQESGVHRYDGTTWSYLPLADGADGLIQIRGVWGTAPNDMWFVGWRFEDYDGLSDYFSHHIFHYDGSTVTAQEVASYTTEHLVGIWGTAADNIWAWGAYVSYHYDGNSWSSPDFGSPVAYSGTGANDIWRSNTDQDVVEHFHGATWTTIPFLGGGYGVYPRPIGPSEAWLLRFRNDLYHSDGMTAGFAMSGDLGYIVDNGAEKYLWGYSEGTHGSVTTFATTPTTGTAEPAFFLPYADARDARGNLYVRAANGVLRKQR